MHASESRGEPPRTEPALRAIAMPADANPHGDIFGGWLLSQMDLAGGTAATRRAKGRTVTVAITAMTFHRPVFIGDEVTCYAEIVRVGTTSITVKVESWARRGTARSRSRSPKALSPMSRSTTIASPARCRRKLEKPQGSKPLSSQRRENLVVTDPGSNPADKANPASAN